MRVNPKEAFDIVTSLEAGVVPKKGIKHLLVGRSYEVDEIISILENVANGGSDLRIWCGDFGSGKSFMMRTIETLSLEKNFVVSTVDLSPNRNFFSSSKKAKALYHEITDRMITKTCQEKSAMETIIQEWINKILMETANENGVSLKDVLSMDYYSVLCQKIEAVFDKLTVTNLSYEFSLAVESYLKGMIENNRPLKINALRWMQGDIDTITEAKKELKIGKIIRDDNWYPALKILTELVSSIGYAGMVVNFDEAVNLYKLPRKQTRANNYEMILNIFNECKTNMVSHLFINFGATRKTVYDENRGFSSYGALKGRLGTEDSMDIDLKNTSRTVLPLKPLSNEQIYTLLEHLTNIYNIRYKSDIEPEQSDITTYMEEQLNRPGAAEFLTPRTVIKDYLEILDLKRQNPDVTFPEILKQKFKMNVVPVYKDADNKDDDMDIEVF